MRCLVGCWFLLHSSYPLRLLFLLSANKQQGSFSRREKEKATATVERNKEETTTVSWAAASSLLLVCTNPVVMGMQFLVGVGRVVLKNWNWTLPRELSHPVGGEGIQFRLSFHCVSWWNTCERKYNIHCKNTSRFSLREKRLFLYSEEEEEGDKQQLEWWSHVKRANSRPWWNILLQKFNFDLLNLLGLVNS